MEKGILICIPIILTLLVSGCVNWEGESPPQTLPDQIEGADPQEVASLVCRQLCQRALKEGRDLSSGPCLADETITGWVCDVAHSPRAAADNLEENQCPAFGDTATHFVEVDPECSFIRAI